MADLRALVISGGRTAQITNADTLLVGTGIKGNTGTLSIGTLGSLTTVLGDFQVNGVTTLVGGTTFNANATFEGNVTFGNATTDTVTFVSRVATDLHFLKEVNHTIDVDASTTGATVGGSLTIASGNGNGAAGGAMSVDAGTGTVGGALSLGTTSAASMSIGRTGTTATFNGAVSMPASAANTLTLNTIAYQFPTVQAAGQVLTTNGAGVLTWAAAAAGTVTGAGVANRIAFWTSGTNISNDANLLFNPAGAASIDAVTSATFGGTNATSVAIGHSGITTTITGGLTQLTGAFSLTGSAASTITTSGASSLTIDSNAALTLGGTTATSVVLGHSTAGTQVVGSTADLTAAGAFSVTGGASSTISTTGATNITINAGAALNLGTAVTTSISIGRTGTTATFNGAVTIPASATNLLTLNTLAYQFPTAQSAGQILTTNGAGVLTWATAGGTIGGSIAATQVAVGSGVNTIAGSAALTFSGSTLTSSAALNIDPATSLTLGGTTATSVALGHSTIIVNINGSDISTSATGSFLLTGAVTSNILTTGGATLNIDPAGPLQLGVATGTTMSIGRTGQTATFNGAVSIPASATNLLTLNTLAYQFPTAQTAGSVLTSNGSGVLTWSSSPSVSQLTITGQTTTGLANGDFGYVSAANTWSKAQNDGTAIQATTIAVNEGTVGSMSLPGSVIEAAKFTTAGGSPANGAEVYLAAAADDGATGAGKLTATANTTVGSFLVTVGVCVDNANYAGAKTAKIIFNPYSPILL